MQELTLPELRDHARAHPLLELPESIEDGPPLGIVALGGGRWQAGLSLNL